MNTWHMQLQMYTWIYVYDHVCLYSTETCPTYDIALEQNQDKNQDKD